MASTVLVTGVSRYLGGRLARELAEVGGVRRVIGVDAATPSMDLGAAEFVRTDIRNPVVARIMSQAAVDTVVHTSVATSPSGGARTSQMEINVLGTMQLLAACQATPSVRRVVVKSTGAVYGSSPRDPALFSEEMNLRSAPGAGYVKDALEVEGYVRGVTRRRPDIDTCVLRMAHIVGPHLESALTDYFRRPVIPIPFGYDARLQLLHEDDAVTALLVAAMSPESGVYNIAGDGILTLTQAAAIIRRVPLPVMSNRGRIFGRAVQRARWAEVSGEQFDFLLWGRGLDTSRMRTVLAVQPKYTTRTALEDFAAQVPNPVLGLGSTAGSVAGSLSAAAAGSLPAVLAGAVFSAVARPVAGRAGGTAKSVLGRLPHGKKGG